MADKPILFSGPMVRAILDGHKSQTRRILKIRGHKSFSEFGPSDTPGYDWHFRDAEMRCHDLRDNELISRLEYAPGDRLWVREAWRVGAWRADRGQMCVDFRADGFADPAWRDVPNADWFENQWIRISDELHRKGINPDTEGAYRWKPSEAPLSWRPSMFMPRWASRLTLIVTDVRVQRLQDISEADAVAEGVERCKWAENMAGDGRTEWWVPEETNVFPWAQGAYMEIWNSLNANRGHGWEANPWVCAISFEAHRCNIDQMEAAYA